MSRLANVFLVVALWAALYLPWLGSSGLRSEEGHRVLPAVEMIESGNYLVPHVAGQPYLRKPPLINWLVAGSFRIFGERNDWTARAPSVVAVLLLALGFVTITRGWLGPRGSLFAAVAWLTSLGMLEKGRMIEIEAVYVSLFGLAFICWLTWWRARRSPWLVWTVPWIFLGLGLLAKGPAHLFFFYAVVFAVLRSSGKTRELLHPAHFLGLAIMGAIFAAWAIPYSQAVRAGVISHTWSNEFLGRFTGAEGTLNDWLLNFPLALAYFLPFGLLLPFVRVERLPANESSIARGLFWGSAIPFVLVLLLPGAIQRYILPTLVPICCLLGLAVQEHALVWRPPFSRGMITSLIALVALGAAIIFPLRSATVQKERPGFPQVAEKVNSALPPGVLLYAVNPGFQPYLFYIRRPVRYLRDLADLPEDARYFIVPAKLQAKVEAGARSAQLLVRTRSFRGEETLLYRRANP